MSACPFTSCTCAVASLTTCTSMNSSDATAAEAAAEADRVLLLDAVALLVLDHARRERAWLPSMFGHTSRGRRRALALLRPGQLEQVLDQAVRGVRLAVEAVRSVPVGSGSTCRKGKYPAGTVSGCRRCSCRRPSGAARLMRSARTRPSTCWYPAGTVYWIPSMFGTHCRAEAASGCTAARSSVPVRNRLLVALDVLADVDFGGVTGTGRDSRRGPDAPVRRRRRRPPCAPPGCPACDRW